MNIRNYIIAVLLALVIGSCIMTVRYIDKLALAKAELALVNAELAQVKQERQAAETAVTTAAEKKEQIHEQAKQETKRTEELLNQHCEWADTPIPDVITEWLCKRKAD